MKYPKLNQTVLCQFILYLPFLLLAIGGFALGILLIEAVSTWLGIAVMFLGLILSLAYLLFRAVLFLGTSDLLFKIRNWKTLRSEYITTKNGSSSNAVKDTIYRRCRKWGTEAPQSHTSECTLFYRNLPSPTISTAPYFYRVAVFSVTKLDQKVYRRCIYLAQQAFRTIPARKPKSRTPRYNTPICVIIILAETITPECRTLPYQDRDFRVCIADCSSGKYYMNSMQEPYSLGDLDRNEESCEVFLLWKLEFGGRPPIKTSPATIPYSLAYSPDTSLWHYISDTWKQQVHLRENYEKKIQTMLLTLPENQISVNEDTIFYKYNTRLYTCYFLPGKNEPNVMLALSPDYESLQYDPAQEKIIRHKCSKAEEARLMSAVRTWAAANG